MLFASIGQTLPKKGTGGKAAPSHPLGVTAERWRCSESRGIQNLEEEYQGVVRDVKQ